MIRLVMVRNPGHPGSGIALATTARHATAAAIVERHAACRPIEVAVEDAEQRTGVGDARTRTERAVRQAVPLGFACQRLLWIWDATALHPEAVGAGPRHRAPWDRTSTTLSTLDLLITTRRVLIAARPMPGQPTQLSPAEIRPVQQEWARAFR